MRKLQFKIIRYLFAGPDITGPFYVLRVDCMFFDIGFIILIFTIIRLYVR